MVYSSISGQAEGGEGGAGFEAGTGLCDLSAASYSCEWSKYYREHSRGGADVADVLGPWVEKKCRGAVQY